MSNDAEDVRLIKVNAANFNELIDLDVFEAQKNTVASNVYSLAEAYANVACG